MNPIFCCEICIDERLVKSVVFCHGVSFISLLRCYASVTKQSGLGDERVLPASLRELRLHFASRTLADWCQALMQAVVPALHDAAARLRGEVPLESLYWRQCS